MNPPIENLAHKFALKLMREARQKGLRMTIKPNGVSMLKDSIADWLEENSAQEISR
jgi:hypothetical protein